MSAMASLQSSFTSLSIKSSGNSSFFGSSASPSQSKIPSVSMAPTVIRMELRRWERKKVKPNSLPIRQKLHVKTGDTVQVIAGSDRGKVTEVTRVFTHNSKVLCKDVNIKTKHVKPKQKGEKGMIVQVEAPIHSSNVMLYSREQKVASRVGHKILEDGTKVRYLIKTGEIIDKPGDWRPKPRKEKKDNDSS